jgi:hypothetical protein
MIWRAIIFLALALATFSVTVAAQISVTPDEKTVVVDEAPEMEVFSYGKTVIVKKSAKGVLTFGGDIIVEGRVDGDVAAVGGSVIQRKDGFIGGDVIILGGRYQPEIPTPLRNEGRETVMYAGYEEELRELTQNPSSLFSPTFSLAFLAQRTLSVLFWFVVSLGLATIAPGAVSRAVARFQLSSLKVVAIGFFTFLFVTVAMIVGITLLPNYLSAILGVMTFVLIMLAYVFGRVALHLSVGKWLQKTLLPVGTRSETLAILIGVVFWTLVLSVPFVWTLALVGLFSVGVGLVLTARSPSGWAAK